MGVRQIKNAAKLKARKPAKKPSKPARTFSHIFGNETLDWLVRNVCDIAYRITRIPTAVAIKVRA